MYATILLGPLYVACFDGELAACGHGIARIDCEIHQYLFDLPWIDANRLQGVIKVAGESNIFTNQSPQHLFNFRHSFVEIDNFGLEHLPTTKCQQLSRQRGGAITRRTNVGNQFMLGLTSLQSRQQQVTATDDDGEQIVEVMRYTARKLTKRFHFLRLPELRLECTTLGKIAQDACVVLPVVQFE